MGAIRLGLSCSLIFAAFIFGLSCSSARASPYQAAPDEVRRSYNERLCSTDRAYLKSNKITCAVSVAQISGNLLGHLTNCGETYDVHGYVRDAIEAFHALSVNESEEKRAVQAFETSFKSSTRRELGGVQTAAECEQISDRDDLWRRHLTGRPLSSWLEAEPTPQYDTAVFCDREGLHNSKIVESCIDGEKFAYSHLQTQWLEIPPKFRRTCVAKAEAYSSYATHTSGKSYSSLMRCIY